ncbi:MAG TPA: isochorismatase family protein, partial [Dongiaceae bacterium]
MAGKITPTADDALIVIDVQNDFCPGGALAVPKGNEIVPLVNRLIDQFDHVVLTQDWHPHGHSSFASTHKGDPFTTIKLGDGDQTLWPDHCV